MTLKPSEETTMDIPTYEEICKSTKIPNSDVSNDSDDSSQQKRNRRQKLNLSRKIMDLSDVKIKTLAEIRAEKKLKAEQEQKQALVPEADAEISSTNSEVTSTSKNEEMAVDVVTEEFYDRGVKRKNEIKGDEEQTVKKKPKLRRPQILDSDNTVSSVGELDKTEVTTKKSSDSVKRKDSKAEAASKFDDENDLLLDEDDFECSNVSLQAEEDLLKDIDDLLSE